MNKIAISCVSSAFSACVLCILCACAEFVCVGVLRRSRLCCLSMCFVGVSFGAGGSFVSWILCYTFMFSSYVLVVVLFKLLVSVRCRLGIEDGHGSRLRVYVQRVRETLIFTL